MPWVARLIDIQRQRHRAARLRLTGVKLTGDLAGLVGGDEPPPVRAPQVGLKCLLHAVLTHQIVHGVPLVGVPHIVGVLVAAPLLLPDGADSAQNVGRQRSVVYAR